MTSTAPQMPRHLQPPELRPREANTLGALETRSSGCEDAHWEPNRRGIVVPTPTG